MVEARQPLGVGAPNVLDVLGAFLEVGGKTGAPVYCLSPLLPPGSRVPLLLLQEGVDGAADHHRTRRALCRGPLVQPRGLSLIKVNLRAIHDV